MLADFQKEFIQKLRESCQRQRDLAEKCQMDYGLFTLAEFVRESAHIIETGIMLEEKKHSPDSFASQKEKVRIEKGKKKGSKEGEVPTLCFENNSPVEKDGKT